MFIFYFQKKHILVYVHLFQKYRKTHLVSIRDTSQFYILHDKNFEKIFGTSTSNPRQVRRFVGMANWYRSFVNNFSDLAGPLTDCLRKSNKPFRLSEEAIHSFNKLKYALSNAPVLAQPDFSKDFVIQCDASRIGVGGVLYQLDDIGRELPIVFVSQKLN